MDKGGLFNYVSSGSVAMFGGMTSNDVAALGGLGFIALTYFTNLVFKVRADRRAEKMTAENLKAKKGV